MARTTREKAEALLLDLDGVVRQFDPTVADAAEARHGLAPGAIMASAFAWERLRPVLVGERTHDEWLESIVADLSSVVPVNDARAAIGQWQAHRGEPVMEVLGFVREVRGHGIPVGLATNATSLLDDDLAQLGLAGEFDAVINSSMVGAHKPTVEFFRAACLALGRPPARCLFVDDDDRNVRGARVAGLSAYRWNGAVDLPYLLAALGL